MRAEMIETLWLTEHQEFSLAELAELSGLAEEELRELIEYGAIAPPDPQLQVEETEERSSSGLRRINDDVVMERVFKCCEHIGLRGDGKPNCGK